MNNHILYKDNTKNKEISVIVPIYNAEDKIENCICKLLCNDCSLEIILVDDGSTDSSLKICNKLQEIYFNKIRVFHKENGGVSSARNIGLKNSLGEIITFADIDDYFEEHALDCIVEEMKKNKVDVLIWDYYIKTNDKIKLCSYWIQDNKNTCKLEDIKRNYWSLVINGVFNPVWNKAFKGNIIREHEVKFDENIIFSEDALFNILFLKHSENIYHIDKGLYYYVINEGSATQRRQPEYYRMLDHTFNKIEAFLGDNILEAQGNQHYGEWLSVIKQTIYHQKYNLFNKKEIEDNKRTKKMLKFFTPITLREKIEIFLIRNNGLYVYCWLKKMKQQIKIIKK